MAIIKGKGTSYYLPDDMAERMEFDLRMKGFDIKFDSSKEV